MDDYQLSEELLDVDAVSALRSAVGWHNLPKEVMNAALKNSIFFASFTYKNTPVAMGRIVGDGFQYFYLQDVIVHPEYQRKGLGGRITDNLVHRVLSHGSPGAFFGLMAAADVSGLYEKYGFRKRPGNMPGMSMWLGQS